MDEKLKNRIISSITQGESLGDNILILKRYKEEGGGQQEALETLESMRTLYDEEFEDRILDLMDFASGFCRPEMRIW